MTVASSAALAAQTRTPAAGVLIALLSVAVFINYIDRGNLATAAPLIEDELHLSNVQFGVLTSAFFWVYTPGQLLSGWLAERLNPYRALGIGFAVWSVATMLTGFSGGLLSLLVMRLLLGLGESAAFPCTSKLMARHIAPSKLGLANGFTQAGIAFGPAVGTLAGGLLMVRYGWRAMFVAFGAVALLWLVPWLRVTRSASGSSHEPAAELPPFRKLLSLREMWGAVTGHFMANYALYFITSWLPLYLVKQRGFDIAEMAQISGLTYTVYGVSSLVSGWLADRWIASGASINRVRKSMSVAGNLGIAICLIGVALGSSSVAIGLLLCCGVFFGMNGTSLWAITQTLAGPVAAARWVSVQNCIANFAGVIVPLVTGLIADRTGSFDGAFYLTSAFMVLGAAGWGLIIRRVEPVNWNAA